MRRAQRILEGRTELAGSEIVGHVFDPADLTKRFVVELFVDDRPAAVARADRHCPSLRIRTGFDRRCGFRFPLDPAALAGHWAEVRIANRDERVGATVDLTAAPADAPSQPARGVAYWRGGLRISGWIRGAATDETPLVRASVSGTPVGEARAVAWKHTGEQPPARAFDIFLPEALANGEILRVDVTDERSVPLDGSPVLAVAFEDGLRATLARRPPHDRDSLRGEIFDRLLPQSCPFSMFERWSERYPNARRAVRGLVAVALVGDGNVQATVESLAGRQACEWVVGHLPHADGLSFEPEDLREFIAEAARDAEAVVFAPAGATFLPHALELLASSLAGAETAVVASADYLAEEANGRKIPVALPEFSYERQLEQGYASLVFAMRPDAVAAAAAKGRADLFGLFLSPFDAARPTRAQCVRAGGFAARLPRFDLRVATEKLSAASKAHLASRRVRAACGPGRPGVTLPSVRVRRGSRAKSASVVIPTRNQLGLLRACIESIRPALEKAGAELIVVDNGSDDAGARNYLRALEGKGAARVLRDDRPFNFARLVNLGAAAARGEALLLLNNDVEALDDVWLDEMLGRLSEPDVGVVGARLEYPSGVIQHGGVVLGLTFGADHAFTDQLSGATGYADLLCVSRECSAVTGACLLTRRDLFRRLGGFDEVRYAIDFNDVDYCLRCAQAGHRVIFTNDARLVHRESASRRSGRAHEAREAPRELTNLRDDHEAMLLRDPYYSPFLSLDGEPFRFLSFTRRW